jgi:hypothetical protein
VDSIAGVERVSLVYCNVDSTVCCIEVADLNPIENSSNISSSIMDIFVFRDDTNTSDYWGSMLLDIPRVFVNYFPRRSVLLIFFTKKVMRLVRVVL